ncbi:hypothetical protein [Kitasatospora sp. MAP5-34]|uniref:Rv1733c family protein n=1 Tax=Kitasatospora sp. MAP5-34 TaxID=3035102 RepID=UPI0024766F3A|nr:hypothetical protein [Kitasatospora sp. MAP5-34]MDH6574717.1 hypothetical protein [Kitasatospora sp. MAP5-34]
MPSISERHGRAAHRTRLWCHLRRSLGKDPNPLCRRIDRARSRLVLALGLSLIASLALSLLIAQAVLLRDQAGARYETQHRHRITATTMTAAVQDTATGVSSQNGAQAQVTWDYPPTGRGTGQVDVPNGTGAGAAVVIWVNDTGRPVSPPRLGTQIVTDAVTAGLGSLAGLSAATLMFGALRRRALDRRALGAWEPAWERVEPLWSGRTRRQPGTGDQ